MSLAKTAASFPGFATEDSAAMPPARSGGPARPGRRAWLGLASGLAASAIVPGCGGGGGTGAGDAPALSGQPVSAGQAGGAAAASTTGASGNPAPAGPVALRAVPVATGLERPWAVAFLPDGRLLVTERPGRLRLVRPDGNISAPLAGVPPVFAQGQGGLLDVALGPDFAANRTVYLTYAEPAADDAARAGTAVLRARLTEAGLTDAQVIFRQLPKVAGGQHFGSRLAFGRDGLLFVTLGERDQRDRAQDLSVHLGKVVRIAPDGSVPADNPFVGRPDARPEIWSLGHRNPQAAAIDPATGALWTVEHGAQGGDEVNRPLPGRNYGWPVITFGRDYDGSPIGEGTARPGMEQPLYYWDPSIAPSGMAFVTGGRYAGWDGSLLVGSLGLGLLSRLVLDGGRVVREERVLQEVGARVRDVRQGPDGFVYLLTDEARGRLLRLEAA